MDYFIKKEDEAPMRYAGRILVALLALILLIYWIKGQKVAR